MDRVGVTHWLGRLAHGLNRAGLGRLTKQGTRLFERRTLEAELLGFRLRGSFRHRAYMAEMRAERRESFMAELFRDAVREGDVVADVGACLGLFTLIAASRVGPGGRVLALEAHPETYPFLVENVAANGLSDRVVAFQRAASDSSGSVRFFIDDTTASSSGMFAAAEASREVIVESSPLDELVDAPERLGAVKIDAEGAEVHVLRGMRETLTSAPPRLQLFVECNPHLLERAGHSTDVLLAELEAAGLTPRLIDEQRREVVPFDGDLGGLGYVNLLAAAAS